MTKRRDFIKKKGAGTAGLVIEELKSNSKSYIPNIIADGRIVTAITWDRQTGH